MKIFDLKCVQICIWQNYRVKNIHHVAEFVLCLPGSSAPKREYFSIKNIKVCRVGPNWKCYILKFINLKWLMKFLRIFQVILWKLNI